MKFTPPATQHTLTIALALALVAGCALAVWHWAFARHLGQQVVHARQQLHLHAQSLEQLIGRYRALPLVLALDPELRAALENDINPTIRERLNQRLERANRDTRASTLTLIDARGIAVAASNWREPGSNVGNDYGFRPYVQQALERGQGRFYGVGVSTGQPGYFLSEALRNGVGQIIGVVVIKIDLNTLEQDWLRGPDRVLVTDAHGVAFLASDNDWRYRLLRPLEETARQALAATRQYPQSLLHPLPIEVTQMLDEDATLVQLAQPEAPGQWLMVHLALPEPGWTLHLMHTADSARPAAYQAAAVTALSGIALLLVALFVQQRVHQVARLVQASSDFPVSTATEVRLLVGGAATLDAIAEAVRAAQHHIHLEYYIFQPDSTGQALRDLLVQRARAGVQVRLLVDALGSKRLGARFLQPLLDAGGEVARFHDTRMGRRLRPVINFRTHRKIVVCDGRVGFTGGVNVADAENPRATPHAYHDVHLRLQGAVVQWLQTVFLEDWAYAQGHTPQDAPEAALQQELEHLLPEAPAGETAVQIITSGPDNGLQAIYRAYLAAINTAEQRVWLATPYFVPTEAALAALTNAALRGVDVQVMVPARSDSALVTAAARSYFDELIRCGVRVHEYAARMLHAKTLVVDGHIALVGSANFDCRSFFLNYEVCAIAYAAALNHEMAAQFQADLRHCQRVHFQRPQPFAQRLFDAAARLCSPLL